MAEKTQKSKKSKQEATASDSVIQGPGESAEDQPTENPELENDLGDDAGQAAVTGKELVTEDRVAWIKESHTLLGQFTSKELKILMNLKRNTSPKAWTLREDLIVLSLPMSNREIAAILQDRNKEAVKKRLQLLRSKGLVKRPRDAAPTLEDLNKPAPAEDPET